LNGWVVSKAGIVQRLRVNPLLSVAQSPVLPEGMRLDAAWPNPASGAVVMLPFVLSRSGTVTLSVHNSAGVEIAVPFSGEISAGEHAVAFDTVPLPNGVYFFTLQAGTRTQSQRFIRLH
jgi:hypothetical protein